MVTTIAREMIEDYLPGILIRVKVSSSSWFGGGDVNCQLILRTDKVYKQCVVFKQIDSEESVSDSIARKLHELIAEACATCPLINRSCKSETALSHLPKVMGNTQTLDAVVEWK